MEIIELHPTTATSGQPLTTHLLQPLLLLMPSSYKKVSMKMIVGVLDLQATPTTMQMVP
jgi:hypothetical protein